jgi:hypothetical protein
MAAPTILFLFIFTIIILLLIGIFSAISASGLAGIRNENVNFGYAYNLSIASAVIGIVGAVALIIGLIVYLKKSKSGDTYTFSLAMLIITVVAIFVISILSAINSALINITPSENKDNAYRYSIASVITGSIGFLITLGLLILIERNNTKTQVATQISNKNGGLNSEGFQNFLKNFQKGGVKGIQGQIKKVAGDFGFSPLQLDEAELAA